MKKFTDYEVWSLLTVAAEQLVVSGKKSNPSISALCRHANISRAHLYASFPHLLEKIRAPKLKKMQCSLSERIKILEFENNTLKRNNAALAQACMELKLSVLKIEQEMNKPRRIKKLSP